jgi:alpha-tubulin suppressor-like RCC1 family protein
VKIYDNDVSPPPPPPPRPQIDAGETSSVAVSDEGEVFTWGWGGSFWGGSGGLGHGDVVTQPSPALVESLSDSKVFITSVSVGSSHMLALTKDGKVFSWGNGEYGRCGNGLTNQPKPLAIEILSESAGGGGKCISIAAGPTHSFAVDAEGYVWAWGKNEASQLGLGAGLVADLNTMEEYPTRVMVEGDEFNASIDGSGVSGGGGSGFNGRVTKIAAGSNHTLALTRDGKVWNWGARTHLSPTLVPFAKSLIGSTSPNRPLTAKIIAAGDAVSAVIEPTGSLLTWSKGGRNEVLGHAVTVLGNPRTPESIDADNLIFSAVSIGANHALAVVA